jgi:hypothetical protein
MLLLIVLARISLAALVYARPGLAIANDSDRYIPIANGILKGTAYSWNMDRPGELLNTVGYPLFLAGVFAVAGAEPGDIALAQLILSGALALSLFFILSRWIGVPAAFMGSALLALDPLTALWSMTILTETLFAAALSLAAAFVLLWSHQQRRLLLILAGIFVAVASLVKPFALLVAAVWTVCLLLFPARVTVSVAARALDGMQRVLLFGLPIVLLIAPWFVRNALLWDCATLSSVDRVTMRDYMAAKVLAESEHIDLAEAQAKLQAADPGACPQQTSKYLGIILANPVTYARLHAAGTVPVLIATNFDRWLQYFGADYTVPDLWRPYMDGGWRALWQVLIAQLQESPGAIGLMLGLTTFQLLLYILAAWGGVAALRRPELEFKWMVILLVGTMTILVLAPGQGGHERFRVPVQPMLCMLISYGLAARRGIAAWPSRGVEAGSAG